MEYVEKVYSIDEMKALAVKARDRNIEIRAHLEAQLNKVQTNLLSLPQNYKDMLPFNLEELNTKTWFPSLYKEDQSNIEEEYKQEVANLKEAVIVYIDSLRESIEVEFNKECSRVEAKLNSAVK